MTQNAMESDNRNQQTNEELKQTRKLTNHRKLVLPIFLAIPGELCANLEILQLLIDRFFSGSFGCKVAFLKG